MTYPPLEPKPARPAGVSTPVDGKRGVVWLSSRGWYSLAFFSFFFFFFFRFSLFSPFLAFPLLAGGGKGTKRDWSHGDDILLGSVDVRLCSSVSPSRSVSLRSFSLRFSLSDCPGTGAADVNNSGRTDGRTDRRRPATETETETETDGDSDSGQTGRDAGQVSFESDISIRRCDAASSWCYDGNR